MVFPFVWLCISSQRSIGWNGVSCVFDSVYPARADAGSRGLKGLLFLLGNYIATSQVLSGLYQALGQSEHASYLLPQDMLFMYRFVKVIFLWHIKPCLFTR